ncbi:MAG: methyltransferase [Rhizorhabdus sp.]|nr:methyltransferase [Rhizorhabdus sp.]
MTHMLEPRPDKVLATADVALLGLLARLKADGYAFVTPTPATHAHILKRPDRREAHSLRDILGWSLPFERVSADPAILAALEQAGMIADEGRLARSRIRVSSLHGDLYLHSAFPTTAEDAVFFGPDSYRFADLIERELAAAPLGEGAHIVDIGTGAGVGAIVAARVCPLARLTMTDINPMALRLATLNATAAGVQASAVLGGDLDGVPGDIDIALANPPYIIDEAGRHYRDGGDMHGGAVALRMAQDAVGRLALGGRLILYTGSAIIDGKDPLAAALGEIAAGAGCIMRYRELDPDIFGEEMARPAYADVERIAVVSAIIERP